MWMPSKYYDFQLQVLTGDLCAREFTLPCTGQGVSQPLKLHLRSWDQGQGLGKSSKTSMISILKSQENIGKSIILLLMAEILHQFIGSLSHYL